MQKERKVIQSITGRESCIFEFRWAGRGALFREIQYNDEGRQLEAKLWMWGWWKATQDGDGKPSRDPVPKLQTKTHLHTSKSQHYVKPQYWDFSIEKATILRCSAAGWLGLHALHTTCACCSVWATGSHHWPPTRTQALPCWGARISSSGQQWEPQSGLSRWQRGSTHCSSEGFVSDCAKMIRKSKLLGIYLLQHFLLLSIILNNVKNAQPKPNKYMNNIISNNFCFY